MTGTFADGCGGIFARRGDDAGDAFADGDVAASASVAAADAGAIIVAIGRDDAALDDDVAVMAFIATADAGREITSRGVERTAAAYGERLAFGNEDAGIVVTTHHIVRRPVLQDYDRIAQAGNARPLVVLVVCVGGDVHSAQRHRCAVGNGQAGVLAARAHEYGAVLQCLGV